MWRSFFFLLALTAQAEQQSTSLSVGPGGVSVSGGDKNLGFKAGGGKAEANFSATGTFGGNQGQSNSQYIVVPNPNYVPPRPSSALTDSDTFFKSIGKDYELPKEYRHKRRDTNAEPTE